MNKDEKILEILNSKPIQKIGLDDFYGRQTVINMLNEAINYSPCCTELKVKEILSFEEWLSHFKKENDCYWLNKETLYCKDAMKLHYDNLPDV